MDKVVLGSLILVVTACSGVGGSTSTSSTTQAATGTNGLFQNGLTTNGVYQNGVYQNGVYQNGVYQNGVYQNGVYQNGVYQNGVYQNGVYQNGVYQNGVYQNGVYQNGVYQNGVYQNGVYQNGVYQNGIWQSGLWSNPVWQIGSNAEALRTNSYTRQFFQYVYACAMPGSFDPSIGPPTDPAAALAPGKYSTTLDPNNGTLACNASGGCDDPFYTCSAATNTCVVPLQGAVGVGVNADGSTWWGSGTCDESCQRWVSACVLARTNAYGVHVDISMRAPSNAPQAIKNALAVGDPERADYSLREGAYYGNVFATTPVDVPSDPSYSGDPGLLVATPQFYACAGPGSNIPEVTKRFCSSQGDQAVIKVPGTCLATPTQLATCAADDSDPASPTFGAMRDCYTSTDRTNLRPFSEVVTVFLKHPISVCGNSVCEANEDDPTLAGYCPSDCHPGSWAQSFTPDVGGLLSDGHPVSTVASDNAVVVAGASASDLTIGGTTTLASSGAGVLIKYNADGSYAWPARAVRFGNGLYRVEGVRVAPNGNIVVVGLAYSAGWTFWMGTFAPDGTLIGSSTPGRTQNSINLSFALDSQGNVLLAGNFLTTITFGTSTFTSNGFQDCFLAKLSPSGDVLWVKQEASGFGNPFVTTGPSDEVLAILNGGLEKRAADGSLIWRDEDHLLVPTPIDSALVDANGDVYAMGQIADPSPTGGQSDTQLGDPNLVKYRGSDGSVLWAVYNNLVSCPQYASCGSGTSIYGRFLDFDPDGNVVLGSYGLGMSDGVVSFGVESFQVFNSPNMFISAYSPLDGRPVWAKQIPMILSSSVGSMTVDHDGRIVVSGNYSGSMMADAHMLVTELPEDPNRLDSFVFSFGPPSHQDTIAPQIGTAFDQTNTQIDTVPERITVEAIGASGATVFYMPPTAIDSGFAGVSVTCTPPSSSIFPIGTTHVTCSAADPLGNASTAGFDVVVKDRLAPTLTDVPTDLHPNGSSVTFTPPIANDQVDGPRPVTCVPPSGSTFAAGTTLVTCSASDTANNTIQASFNVIVSAPADTTPPVITVPASQTLEATGPTGAIAAFTASATDNVDGTDAVTCTPASGATFPIATTTVACSSHDAAGNAASASFTVKVSDTTAPALAVPASLAAEATSSSGRVVTYTTSATDLVDGTRPVTCAPASGATFALGTTTVSCNASDTRGNAASKSFAVTIADTTPPVVTVPANITKPATSASGAVVTFASSATDAIDGAVPATCAPASGSTFAIGTTTVTCSAHDAHSNTASKTFTVTVTNTDTTPPVITVPANISSAASTATGAPVTFTVSATDAVDGTVPVSCSKASGTAFALGTTTVTCSAHDAHGNSASRSFTVTVQVSWGGVLLPINSDGSAEFKLGSIVPVRFALTGPSANLTNAVATVTFTKTSSAIAGTRHKLPRYLLPTSGTTAKYNPLTHHYYFRNDTTGLTAGTYTVKVDFHDGATHTAQISLGNFSCGSCENDGGDD
jgi:hypothetical protein